MFFYSFSPPCRCSLLLTVTDLGQEAERVQRELNASQHENATLRRRLDEQVLLGFAGGCWGLPRL